MMPTPVISVRNGVTRHPDHRMAEPVSLDILSGEQVAIVGPNAAGKTRLVEILTGRWPLLAGNEVKYDFGADAHRLASDNIRVMTFRDSYGEADATYYLQKRWNQHDIDDDTPMADGKPLISLSSGELRKYQLRRALDRQPRLLVLDNPFIGLDTQARQQLRELLTTLTATRQLQVILVVNRDSDIPDFITHVIRIEPGCHMLPKATRQQYLQRRCTNGLTQGVESTHSLQDNGFAESTRLTSETKGEVILKFNQVSIRYGQHTILDNLNWEVRQGEHWALSGANGSGKSTLLSLVCADNPQAYACDIELFGRRRGTGESIWDIKRHIGYVSPEMHRAYLKDLPAIDIVASGLHDSVGLYVRPKPEQRQQCILWMQRFGIEHLADRAFLQLSSGEQRLCLLARAFVKEPDLLILDEPFHGLDDERRLMATAIIERYCTNPLVTLIIVSHYADELPHGITHQLILRKY